LSSAHISKQSKIIAILDDQNCFCCYQQPPIANFDNSSEFSFEFLELLCSYGVTLKPTTVKNPQTNALEEQVHQVIGDAIHQFNGIAYKKLRQFCYSCSISKCHLWLIGNLSLFHCSVSRSTHFWTQNSNQLHFLSQVETSCHSCQIQIHHINALEGKSQISHDYIIDDLVYICKAAIKQIILRLQNPISITKGSHK
jgi:hypothetical protein